MITQLVEKDTVIIEQQDVINRYKTEIENLKAELYAYKLDQEIENSQ